MPRIQAEALSKKMRYWAPKKRKKSRRRLTKTKRRLVNKIDDNNQWRTWL